MQQCSHPAVLLSFEGLTLIAVEQPASIPPCGNNAMSCVLRCLKSASDLSRHLRKLCFFITKTVTLGAQLESIKAGKCEGQLSFMAFMALASHAFE